MFYKRIFWSLTLLFITQLSFAGGNSCSTVTSGNWSDNSIWNCEGGIAPENGGNISIKSGHTVTLDIDTPNLNSLQVEAGGDFAVAASANGLNINATVNAIGNTIDFTEASIELFGDFTINAHNTDIELGDVIGEFALTLNSTTETRFEGIIGNPTPSVAGNLTALTTDFGGTTVFANTDGGINNPNIIVYGPRIFNDDVLLVSATHIKGSGGPITFNGTVDTESSANFRYLIITFIANSTLSFNQDVGVNRRLGEFFVFNSSGATLEINTSQFITHGTQLWNENVILNSPTGTVTLENRNTNPVTDIMIDASGKVIRSADGNPNSLVAISNGGVRFTGEIGDDMFPIVALSVSSVSDTRISGPISTTNAQVFNGNIVLTDDAVLTGSIIDIQNNVDNAGFDLTIDNTDVVIPSSIAGVVSGSGDLIKTGAGNLEISTQTSMSGNVFLNEGSLTNTSLVEDLFVNAPVITLASSTIANLGLGALKVVNLTNGQTLQGSGYCNCALIVSGGVVSPGLTSGQVTNKLSMNYMEMSEFSTLEIDLNGTSPFETYDQIIVEGATLTEATLNLSLGFTPAIGDSFTIIKVNGPPPVAGIFVGLSEGDTIIINDRIFSISYNGGDGNDVELTVVGATRYYVDADAVVMGDGLSWNTAFNTLQDALTVAISGEIWVAQGVYYPDEGGLQVDNNINATFTLVDGVSIYGGFDGTETDLSQRNPTSNITVLSGDITQNDTVNSDNIVESTDMITAPNSRHVVVGSNVNTGTVLDGLTITAGSASGNDSEGDGAGGGMFCGQNNSGPSLKQVTIIGSFAEYTAGAAYGCAQSISDSSFINNTIDEDQGGAILTVGGLIENSLFKGNRNNLESGGAIYLIGGTLVINNSQFLSNQTAKNAGAILSRGNLTISNSLFKGNKSGFNGGAIYLFRNSSVTVLTNNTFTGNKSGGSGGAIRIVNNGMLDINNSIIWNNLDGNNNNTISDSIRITNAPTVNISNSLVQYSGGSSNWDVAAATDSGNNLDQDPLFVTDADPTTAPNDIGNARLKVGSPVIAQGDDSFVSELLDLDGNTRSVDTVEMGAYEFASYIVSVDVSGLIGSVVLQNNGADDLMLATNATHEFSLEVARADSYDVSLFSQSTTVNQNCVLANASGVVADDPITNITLVCTTIKYGVGVDVTGLANGVTLSVLNNAEVLDVTSNGLNNFATNLDDGSAYDVSIDTNPSSPNQTCLITSNNATGNLSGADVVVTVECTTTQYNLGVDVTGLASGNSVVFDNDGESLTALSDGQFNFATSLDDGSGYDVMVTTQPSTPNQMCSVEFNSGNLSGADVLLTVACTTNQYLVGGMASGLASGNFVELVLGAENLSVNANSAFVFQNPLTDETNYTISINTQPTTPNQTCQLVNPTGTIMGADIDDVEVNCVTNQYTIGGTILGLISGNNLVLQNNLGDDLTVSSSGSFDFSTAIDDLQAYDVKIFDQPTDPIQPCVISNNTGNVAGNNVTTVSIVCGLGDDLIYSDGFE